MNNITHSPAIRLTNVGKVYISDYFERRVLDDINLTINHTDVVAILGDNNSGNKILGGIIGLLERHTSGVIEFDGVPISSFGKLQLEKIRNRNVGYIFSENYLIQELTVSDNIAIGMQYRDRKTLINKSQQIMNVINNFNLTEQSNCYPKELSSLQRRLTSLARALVSRPSMVIVEQMVNPDNMCVEERVLSSLLEMNEKYGTTIILVTSNEYLARKCKRIIRLFEGGIVY